MYLNFAPCTSFYHQERRRERAVTSRSDYSADHNDLCDDKTVVKMQREQRKLADKENRERRGRVLDEREADQDNLDHFPEKRKSSRRAEGPEAYSGSASHTEKDNLKSKLSLSDICFFACFLFYIPWSWTVDILNLSLQECIFFYFWQPGDFYCPNNLFLISKMFTSFVLGMYNEAFVFCEKVKERLCSQDDYQTFLKCLNIFSNGIIQTKQLQNLVLRISLVL